MNSTFIIQGMTCSSCVKTITERLSTLPEVDSVQVDLEKSSAEISSNRTITLTEIKSALSDLPKYTVQEQSAPIMDAKKSFLKTYQPLFLVFAFILLVSIANQIRLQTFNSQLFMNHIMAGFFIGLSFFKFLDLHAFAESFAGYDPIAKRWMSYGLIYPFIELGLGFLFIAGIALTMANIATLLILSLTTIGVYQRLQTKSAFQCACLGTTFNLPLSNITIAENLVMIGMALFGLFF